MRIASRTKIEMSPALVRQASGLDDLARILFPDNRAHRRVFVAIWVELKYSDRQFMASLYPLCQRYGFSARVLEAVRDKLRKAGLLKRVSQFDSRFGYRSGWTFSSRFAASLEKLAEIVRAAHRRAGRPNEEERDRDALHYV